MDASKRPFSAGSRQAPDPYDQFLEQKGFYRKHTARDSTCLFRVVSEQIFDVQLYHEKVRHDCVNFMRKHRDLYENKIKGNYDDYLDEMSKFRTHGSFLELNALAHVYQRNVLLFEPYNCGTWFIKCDNYENTLMIFFSPDKHFDSIFPTTYIEQAAYCQALVYEILYVKVFKLPDVMYSVERMLHDPDGRTMQILERQEPTGETVEDRIVTSEGREFILDSADNTECVLDNYRLCHFHNKEDFASIVDIYRNRKNEDTKEFRNVRTQNGKGSKDLILVNPMLCEKKISCVRQLLREGITPFPYKVAKALDPSIYRNIEFDSWSDTRRELKYRNWYLGGNYLQVGAKCLVKLDKTDDRSMYCYIQEMKSNKGPCVVYIEDLAECRTVEYEKLQPLSTHEVHAWGLPFKYRRHTDISLKISDTIHKKKNPSQAIDFKMLKLKSKDNINGYSCCTPKSFYYSMNNFTGMADFYSSPIEMVVMPFVTNGNKYGTNKEQNQNENGANQIDYGTDTDGTSCGLIDMCSATSMSGQCGQSFCYSYSDPVSYDPVTSSSIYGQPYFAQPYTTQGQFVYPLFGGPSNSISNTFAMPQTNGRNHEAVPNFLAKPSLVPNGSDLPINDLTTLRYFYNLGIEYFRQNQFRMHPPLLPVINESSMPLNTNTESYEGTDVRLLRGDLEVMHMSNSSDDTYNTRLYVSSNLQAKTDNTPTKRKYGTKPQKPSSGNKNVYTKGNKLDASLITAGNNGSMNETSQRNSEENGLDVPQTVPYNMQVYSPSTCPVGIPYYTVDSTNMDTFVATQGAYFMPTYMLHPYGTIMATAPVSSEMLMHDNIHYPEIPIQFGSGTNYPPVTYTTTTAQGNPGYAVCGYSQQTMYATTSSEHTNTNDNNNDSGLCNSPL